MAGACLEARLSAERARLARVVIVARGGFWAPRGRLADLSVRGGALVISRSEPRRSDLWWLFDTEPSSELSLSQRLAKAADQKLGVT